MKKSCTAAISCYLTLILLLSAAVADAGSAIWDLNPGSGDWNTPTNWMSATVPNGLADTATFALSNTTAVSISANTTLDGITFAAGASSFTITASPSFILTLSGTGITNNSGSTQNFVAAVGGAGHVGQISFTNSASAGISTIFTNGNGTSTVTSATIFYNTSTAASGFFINDGGGAGGTFAEGGQTLFHNTSTAANGSFVNNGATASGGFGGATVFDDNSTAGNGTFTNNGGAASGVAALGSGNTIFLNTSTAANGTFINNAAPAGGAEGGVTEFGIFPSGNLDSPSAGNATFINNGAAVSGAVGGKTVFYETSTADAATLIANGGINGGGGGEILFEENSTGGTPRVEVFGNGFLDISPHLGPPAAPSMPGSVTIGSIEGDGNVFLGANNLTVGSNNMSTTFSGVVQDGGSNGGTGGSLTKIGTGTLTLSGSNTYTGATTIDSGELVVGGSITSDVTVNSATLAGSGTVGAVTVNSGGTLAPGDSPGILTVQGNLKLMMGANYLVALDGTVVATQYSQVNVFGTVSVSGATLLVHLGFTPAIGTTFIIINNHSSDPVTGTFDGLSEGSTFTVSGQSFTISYHGGDGNDVTLTAIVPEPGTFTLLIAGGAGLAIGRLVRCRYTARPVSSKLSVGT